MKSEFEKVGFDVMILKREIQKFSVEFICDQLTESEEMIFSLFLIDETVG